jgi:hypothetical protein
MTRIGVIGHRDISPDSVPLIQAALRRLLVAKAGSRLVGVSCLAPSADQLFAQTVLDLSGRLEVILPAADYRESQVSPDNAATFDRLVAAAATVRVMGFQTSSPQAYRAATNSMLSTVETLVAIWDGHPANRFDSTASIVEAVRLGLPTSIVWPPGATRITDQPSVSGTSRHELGWRPPGSELSATAGRISSRPAHPGRVSGGERKY